MEPVDREVDTLTWLYNLEEENFVAVFEDRGNIVMEFEDISTLLPTPCVSKNIWMNIYFEIFE